MKVNRSSRFKRTYKKLPPDIQNDFIDKIRLFTDNPQNPILRTHKLKGKLQECYAFYLKEGWRVLFDFTHNHEINLIAIGHHDSYKKWQV